ARRDLVLGPGIAVAQRGDVAVPAGDRAEHQASPGAVTGRDAALEVLRAECDVSAAGTALEPRLDHACKPTRRWQRFGLPVATIARSAPTAGYCSRSAAGHRRRRRISTSTPSASGMEAPERPPASQQPASENASRLQLGGGVPSRISIG